MNDETPLSRAEILKELNKINPERFRKTEVHDGWYWVATESEVVTVSAGGHNFHRVESAVREEIGKRGWDWVLEFDQKTGHQACIFDGSGELLGEVAQKLTSPGEAMSIALIMAVRESQQELHKASAELHEPPGTP